MALIEQIAPIVNDAVADAIGGSDALSTIDTTDFVSMGKVLGDGQSISSVKLYESFFASLANRIIKTVYAVRAYTASQRGILRDETEWGAFKQKVHYELVDAVDNPAYKIPDRSGETPDYTQASPYDVSTTITIKSLLFGGQGTWSVELVRPVAQIMTAFTGAAEMAAFIDGIYVYVENSMQLDIEAVEAAAANTGIAVAIVNGKSRNLLSEYNALPSVSTPVTVAGCLSDPGFLRYAAKEIRQTIRYMGKMSRLFNAGGMPKFTPEDRLTVEMLDTFTSASEVYMQSDTFHRELVELPRYTPVEFWQRQGALTFGDVSSIKLQHDEFITEDNETGVVEATGVLAFLHDIDAVAAQFGEFYDWEEPNVRSRVVNVGRQARKGYSVDPNENMFVFYVRDMAAVTQTLTNVTSSFTGTSVEIGSAFSATLTAAEGYTLGSVAVTMGGVDITATAYSNGEVTISNVTGAIAITASGTSGRTSKSK